MPDREVIVRAADRGGDRGGYVAVLDQLDSSARGPDLLDQVVMTRPVEDDRGHVVDHPPEGVGDRADVVADRLAEVDRAAGFRTDGHLAHVHVGQHLERAWLADRDHGHRAVAATGHNAAPFERVERKIYLLAAGAERLPCRELARLASCADHDPSLDRQQLEREAHRVGRVLLRGLLIGPAKPAGAGQRRPLGHARVALAEAEARLAPERADPFFRLGLRHCFTVSGSAAASTSSMTSPITSSMFPFSITGTWCLRARSRM